MLNPYMQKTRLIGHQQVPCSYEYDLFCHEYLVKLRDLHIGAYKMNDLYHQDEIMVERILNHDIIT